MKRIVNPEISRAMIQRAASLDIDNMAAGAKLPEQHAAEFMEYVRAQAVGRQYFDVVEIDESGVMRMPYLETSGNVVNKPQGLLNPADYNVAFFNDGEQVVRTFNGTAIAFIPDRFMRENTSAQNGNGQAGVDTALNLLAQEFLANFEQMFLYGNSTTAPAIRESEFKNGGSTTQFVRFDFRAQANGWLQQMESGIVVDAENSDDVYKVLGTAWEQYPERYQQYEALLAWHAPTRLKRVMKINLATKDTVLADNAINGRVELQPYGFPINEIPLLATNPPETEHITMTGTTAQALQYKPIVAADVVVLPSTLAATPVTPYIQGTDYSVNEANGTITRIDGGAITAGQVVKVQYKTGTKLWLGPPKNVVIGLSRDMSIESWRYAPAEGTFYVMSGRMGMGIRNVGANVLIKNLKLAHSLTGI
jgi:hypothetical protein